MKCDTQTDISKQDVEGVVDFPDIRTFRAAKKTSHTPLFDLSGVDHAWIRPNVGKIM